MAIKVSGTEVISDSRALSNIASVDAATVTALSNAGVGGAPSTSDVLTALAGTSSGAVGSYAFLGQTGTAGVTFGSTYSGSGLRPAGIEQSSSWGTTTRSIEGYAQNTAQSGTWRCMGTAARSGRYHATIWLRIS